MVIITKLLGFVRRKIKTFVALVVAVGVVVGGLTFLPEMGLRWGLIKELTALGMASIHIGDTDLRLFGGRVVVRGVSAQPTLGDALGLNGLDVLVNWRQLLSKQVSVPKADVDGLSVTIRRKGGKLEINGISLSGSEKTAVTEAPGTPWGVDVRELHFQQGRIQYQDEQLKLDIAIAQLDIFDVNSRQPDLPARFHLKGTLDGHPVLIDGSARLFAANPAFQVELDGQGVDMAAFQSVLKASGLDKVSGKVTLHAIASGDFSVSPVVALDGKVTVEALQYGDGLQIAKAELGIQQAKLNTSTTDFEGSLVLAAQTVSWAEAALKVQVGASKIVLNDLHFDAAKETVTTKGTLSLDPVAYQDQTIKADLKQIAWTGAVSAALKKGLLSTLHQEGHLQDGGATLLMSGLRYGHKALSIDGTTDLSLNGAKSVLTAALNLGMDGFALADDKAQQTLLAVRHVEVDSAKLDPSGGMTINRVVSSGLQAIKVDGAKGYPWRVEASSVQTSQIGLPASGAISIGAVAMNDAVFRLTRAKEGLVGLPASSETQKPSGSQKADPTAPLQFSLGRFNIGGKSRLDFEDKSLPETMRMSLTNLGITVTDVTTERPNRDSTYDVKASAKQSTLVAKGTFRPFADLPTAKINGTITAFELPPLSPYVNNSLGVLLQTGHLDSDVTIEMDQGALNGKVKLTLSNLDMVEPQEGARLSKQTGMPLQTVLGLLKDDQDRIHLTVPVGGNISDPSYDVSDAVSQAIGGALRTTAATTLKILFPVAGLIDLLADSGDGAMALDPILFPAGKDTLEKAQLDRISTIGGLMKSRPQIALTLCGIATLAEDWPVLLEQKKTEQLGMFYRLQKALDMQAKPEVVVPDNDALEDLASRRAESIKSVLVGESGIDAGRLFGCHAKVESDPKAVPSVHLTL